MRLAGTNERPRRSRSGFTASEHEEEDRATDESGECAQGQAAQAWIQFADACDEGVGGDECGCAQQGGADQERGVARAQPGADQVWAEKADKADGAGEDDRAARECAGDEELCQAEALQVDAQAGGFVVREGGDVHRAGAGDGRSEAKREDGGSDPEMERANVVADCADEQAICGDALVWEQVLEQGHRARADDGDDHAHEHEAGGVEGAGAYGLTRTGATGEVDEQERGAGAEDRRAGAAQAAWVGETSSGEEAEVDGDHDAKPGAGSHAQEVGGGEGVSEKSLEECAGEGEAGADEGGGADAEGAEFEEELVVGGGLGEAADEEAGSDGEKEQGGEGGEDQRGV